MQDDLIDITWFEEMFPPVKPDHDDKLDTFCYSVIGRGNGKSFRQLKEMMKAIDEGKKVIVMPYHQGYSYMKSFIDELYDNIQKYEIDILKEKERQIMANFMEDAKNNGLYVKREDGSYEKLCDVEVIKLSPNCKDEPNLNVEGYLNTRIGYNRVTFADRIRYGENKELKEYLLNNANKKINDLINNPFNAMPKIEKVIFNPPATIVKWKDGTKTVVKCQDDDEFDWEKGLAMAYVKRAFNNDRTYYGLFKKNEPDVILPNSNMRYDPKVAKEVRIIVPRYLPVTGDIIQKAFDLIMKECNKKIENGIELGN